MSDSNRITPEELDVLIDKAREQHAKEGRGLPPTGKMVKNFAKALVKHVGDGLRKSNLDLYKNRINICNGCDLREGNRCTHELCGCFIDKKAWWMSEKCPIDKW